MPTLDKQPVGTVKEESISLVSTDGEKLFNTDLQVINSRAWTPVLSDGTNNATSGASAAGTYSRIGSLILFAGRMQTTALGSVSGAIRITGLPETAASSAAIYIGWANGLNITAGNYISGHVSSGSKIILLYNWDIGTGVTVLDGSEWSDDGDVLFSGHYFI